MRRGPVLSTVALVAIVATACQERSATLTPGPKLQMAAVSAPACDFKAVSQTANRYFSGTEAKVVRTIITAMQSAGAFTTAAQDSGFSVMSHIAANVTAGNADATDASGLTNALLACMYSSAADLPATFPEDFTVAANPLLHGAYAVRGGAADVDSVVFSRPAASPFSGIGPDSVNPAASWAPMLAGDPAPRRILVYGVPGTSSRTFDWRVVPRSTSFAPPVIVAVCLDPDAGGNTTSLLHEQNVGLLPFVHGRWLDLATCSPTSASRTASGPLDLALGAARWGARLFAPAPLSAANTTIIDGLGGATGGVHSEFGAEPVDTVTLTFVVQPSDVRVNQVITPPVVVQATHATTGSLLANVAITLSATNNNGTPATLNGTLTVVTDYSGRATFSDLSETKTGGYLLVASGAVGGRPAIVVASNTSARFNVRP